MINMLPSRVLDNKGPIELLNDFYPHFRTSNGLTPRVFGCTAFIHVHSQHRGELDPRDIKCVFLGYSSTQKGYKCYNPLSKKFYISVDVTFFKHKPFFLKSSLQGKSLMIEDSPSKFESSFGPLKNLELPSIPIRKSVESESPPSPVRSIPITQVYSRKKVVPK